MHFENRLEQAVALARNAGFTEFETRPPAWRMVRALGLQRPLPLFASVIENTTLFGACGAALMLACWAVPMQIVGAMPLDESIGLVFYVSTLFGLTVAEVIRFRAARRGLLRWESIGNSFQQGA